MRLDRFELPPLGDGDILARVVTNSVCMSDLKAYLQGERHKRVPADIAVNPIMLGHEFCGEIVEVGSRWAARFSPGDRFSIQPALNYEDRMDSIGYSLHSLGGFATHVLIPESVIERGCLLPYRQGAFFLGSLAEPVSCVVGTFRAMYHTKKGSYEHRMGLLGGGNMAILAGAGPMGLIALDLALHQDRRPSLIVVTDIDHARLERAQRLFPVEAAAKRKIRLVYLSSDAPGQVAALRSLSGGRGFDDVLVMAPVKEVVEQADAILAYDGCLNFFAGPEDGGFSASVNMYNIHYGSTHLVGTSGGNTDDLSEALRLIERQVINPAVMVTHIGGLGSALPAIRDQVAIGGGKKLIYTHLRIPLVALKELHEAGKTDPLFGELDRMVSEHGGLWSTEAEQYLLTHAPHIDG